MKHDPAATRRRILEAADELFYGEGILSVGVDAVAARAGVTKRTLYYHFRSKDDLIAAYLEARDLPTLERYRAWLDEGEGDLAAQIAGMFRKLAHWATAPRWKGCGFIRAAAELAGLPGHPALAVAARHKAGFEAWLAGRLEAEGVAEAGACARRIVLLLDGASARMLIHRDPAYAEEAAAAAVALLRAEPRALTPAATA